MKNKPKLSRSLSFVLLTLWVAIVVTACTFPIQAPAQGQAQRQYLPVPEQARPPEFPEAGYLVDDLGDGLYSIRYNWGENSMFLVTQTGVVVVDAPPGDLTKLAIKTITDLPVTHFIYSHPHADHTGGAALLAEDNGGITPVYIAHEAAAERIRRAEDPRRPVPTAIFTGTQYILDTGGEQLILDYHGDLHSAGDLFIYAPKQKVPMLVDVITPKWAPYYKLGHTPNVPLFMDIASLVLNYDFETFLGGHAFHYGTRADIEAIGRYLDDLEATARQVYVENNVDYSRVEQANVWAGSQTFYETLARQTAERMPKHWLTELAGADVFLEDNAHTLIYSFWTDYPEE